MRKTSAVLASLSLVAIALTGCAAAPTFAGETCDRTANETKGLADSVTASGDIGEAPDVDVITPLGTEKTAFADLVKGDGPAVVSGGQGLVAEISIFSGETGERVYETAYDPASSPVGSLDSWVARSPGLADPLQCVTEGSRVVAALTPEDFGEANLEGFGLAADDTAVFVIDVVDVFLPKAQGALQFNDASGLPTVVRAPDGTPGIIIPDTAAPKSVVTQTLIEGDGPVVTEEDTLVTHIVAVGWDDKKVVSSSWETAPNVGPAAQELVGATVGSQLLVVTPDAEAGKATAIVVDILGVTTAPPAQ